MNATIGLDTNILARYLVAPGEDPSERQQFAQAQSLIDSGQPLMVCKTVLLELEWVLRGFYRYSRADIGRALGWLTEQAHIELEDRSAVEQALANYTAGFDFADALHHASYAGCNRVASFDDRGFVRRGERLKLQPPVRLPGTRRSR